MAVSQPRTLSLLSPNGFDLVVQRLPNTTFFLQSVELPEIEAGNIQVDNKSPFKAHRPGDSVSMGTFTMTFMADEDLESYYEIQSWIYHNVSHKGTDAWTSDATVLIKTNALNPNKNIRLVGAYPVSISSLPLKTTEGPDDPIVFTVNWRFLYFYFEDRGLPDSEK